MKINLGCGHLKKKGWVNIDNVDNWNPEIICDLNKPLPIGSNTVTEVYASHVLEHLNDIDNIIFEIHRICKPGASVTIIVPIGENWMSWPQHKIPFSKDSYKYFEALIVNYNPAFRVLVNIADDKELKLILEVLK